MKTLRIKVYGQVQGVFFRSSTKEKAESLRICGWVRNEPDGTVLIIAQGPENNLKELIRWCYNEVEYAKVAKVDTQWKEVGEEFKGFVIKYD
jgi:acylphosphatase